MPDEVAGGGPRGRALHQQPQLEAQRHRLHRRQHCQFGRICHHIHSLHNIARRFCTQVVKSLLTEEQGDGPYDEYGSCGAARGGLELQREADGVPAVQRDERQRQHRDCHRHRLHKQSSLFLTKFIRFYVSKIHFRRKSLPFSML